MVAALDVGPEGAQSSQVLALQAPPRAPLPTPPPHPPPNPVYSYSLATCRDSLLQTGSG